VCRSQSIPRKQYQQPWRVCEPPSSSIARQARFYSDKSRDIESKVEDAKERLEERLGSQAESVASPGNKLSDAKHETIVKTEPVESSIVEPATNTTRDETKDRSAQTVRRNSPNSPQPPSQWSTETIRARFGHFMDNFQSHLFIASRRLNDLTGYSTIEALKNDIAAQENLVQSTREQVKDAREQYSSAIATRSATQREVNDLLHRKHAWTPTDLERFTELYRSDHANEQTEVAAQKEVADAETKYEEASTKLGRAILARYHEEQVWSDKIRQMSTWGTWGLMGLNVLLFVVFQIMIEPWRRRRLVRGFEEKVELALQERDAQLAGLKDSVESHAAATAAAAGTAMNAGSDMAPAMNAASERAESVAGLIAEQIADAVSGASPAASTDTTAPGPVIAASQQDIEAAAEELTTEELANEAAAASSPPLPAYPSPSTPSVESLFASTASGYAYYADAFRELWNEEKVVVVTQRELTTHVLEGAVGGAAVMGLLLALLRPR
jgi:sensitive to high expression protein 9, mitochondrial